MVLCVMYLISVPPFADLLGVSRPYSLPLGHTLGAECPHSFARPHQLGPSEQSEQRHLASGRLPVEGFGAARLARSPTRRVRIAENLPCFAVRQSVRLGDIEPIRDDANRRVHQSRMGLDAALALAAEVPLLALFGLMHCWTVAVLADLRHRQSNDSRRIKDSAFASYQPALSQKHMDGSRRPLSHPVALKQVVQGQQWDSVRCGLARKITIGKALGHLRVVNGVFLMPASRSSSHCWASYASNIRINPSGGRPNSPPLAVTQRRVPCRYRISLLRSPWWGSD